MLNHLHVVGANLQPSHPSCPSCGAVVVFLWRRVWRCTHETHAGQSRRTMTSVPVVCHTQPHSYLLRAAHWPATRPARPRLLSLSDQKTHLSTVLSTSSLFHSSTRKRLEMADYAPPPVSHSRSTWTLRTSIDACFSQGPPPPKVPEDWIAQWNGMSLFLHPPVPPSTHHPLRVSS